MLAPTMQQDPLVADSSGATQTIDGKAWASTPDGWRFSDHQAWPIKPHIILWLVDDQGWANAGFHNKHVITPTMDTLAKEGALLDRHYTAPWRTHC